MNLSKHSILWWCFSQQKAMTIERMVRFAADIGYGAIELAEPTWDGYMSLLVSDICIEYLYSGTLIAVPTPVRPGFYQKQELQGEVDVN